MRDKIRCECRSHLFQTPLSSFFQRPPMGVCVREGRGEYSSAVMPATDRNLTPCRSTTSEGGISISFSFSSSSCVDCPELRPSTATPSIMSLSSVMTFRFRHSSRIFSHSSGSSSASPLTTRVSIGNPDLSFCENTDGGPECGFLISCSPALMSKLFCVALEMYTGADSLRTA